VGVVRRYSVPVDTTKSIFRNITNLPKIIKFDLETTEGWTRRESQRVAPEDSELGAARHSEGHKGHNDQDR